MPGPNSNKAEPVRLRQIALVARDLEEARKLLCYVLGTEVMYVDKAVGQWGLENILLPLGGEVLEVVSPTKDGTTAGRLLDKRGDGGYMLIMQTTDANARKTHIESNKLAKVIWTHTTPTSTAVQYHPKGIPGGVIPELDSQTPSEAFPKPLQTKISPWHACGPDNKAYLACMKKYDHLSLLGAVCRLKPGEGSELAATQWQDTFGVTRVRDLLGFTNARVGFVRNAGGETEGIVSVTVGVRGAARRDEILRRAKERGCVGTDGMVRMVGVRWGFSVTGEDAAPSKL